MNILINTAHQRFGGAIQVALSFIHECRHFPQHNYYVWVGPGVRKSLREQDFPDNFHFQHFDFGVITLAKTFRIHNTLSQVEKEVQPDCIIATSGPSYFHSQAPQIVGFNLGLYIYSNSLFQEQLNWYQKIRKELKRRLHYYYFKRDADYFVVQTDDVNQRVRQALDTDQVLRVTNTASSYYTDWTAYPPKLSPKAKGTFRFITISSYYAHKNLELIPEVLRELQSRGITQVEFVLTLKEQDFQTHIGAQPGIINVGPVRPEACPSLYQECDALFLPTLAECFSASYPEAMSMEKPIVTTDLGFARSICGEAALFYEAKNARAAAEQIERLIHDQALQKDLITKGKEQLKAFDTPRERAEKYLALCEKLGKGTTV